MIFPFATASVSESVYTAAHPAEQNGISNAGEGGI